MHAKIWFDQFIGLVSSEIPTAEFHAQAKQSNHTNVVTKVSVNYKFRLAQVKGRHV